MNLVVFYLLVSGITFGFLFLYWKIKKHFDKYKTFLTVLQVGNNAFGKILEALDKDPNVDNAFEKFHKIVDIIVDAAKKIETWHALYGDKPMEEVRSVLFNDAYEYAKKRIQKLLKVEELSKEMEGVVKFILENAIDFFFRKFEKKSA